MALSHKVIFLEKAVSILESAYRVVELSTVAATLFNFFD